MEAGILNIEVSSGKGQGNDASFSILDFRLPIFDFF